MKEVIINYSVKERIENAVRNAIKIYFARLNSGYYEVGLEDSFKMYLGDLIGSELELNTYTMDERFVVMFEKNMPINRNKDYIDIVIKHQNKDIIELYPIELKFKKITDEAPDLGNIYSYIDIYNLDNHIANSNNVKGGYYIFLTDYEVYTKPSKKGTRKEIPMYDGYIIEKNHRYIVTGKAAKGKTTKYPNGFMFNKDYKIEYKKILIGNKPYWYYIIEL